MSNQWKKLSITRVPTRYLSPRYRKLVRQDSDSLRRVESQVEQRTRITYSLAPTEILPVMHFDTEPLRSITIPRLRHRLNTTYITIACAMLLLCVVVGLVIVISYLPSLH